MTRLGEDLREDLRFLHQLVWPDPGMDHAEKANKDNTVKWAAGCPKVHSLPPTKCTFLLQGMVSGTAELTGASDTCPSPSVFTPLGLLISSKNIESS